MFFLFRLITTRPARAGPARQKSRGRLGQVVKNQLVEVLGQKKLLKWSIPGVAHLFVFWAFLILGTVYLEAFGILFSPQRAAGRSRSSATGALLGFAQDFIAVMCLVGLATFAAIRLRNDPHKQGRKSRFSGSHLGGAWLILGMIVNVIWTLFFFRGASAAAGNFPYGNAAFVSGRRLGSTVLPTTRSWSSRASACCCTSA